MADPTDWKIEIIDDAFAVIYVPTEQAGEPEVNSYSYRAIPNCYTYMDIESLNASGVFRLHNHPYLNLRGAGTMVAVIDSGIDYQNPLFRTGERSKILCLWDQTLPGGQSEHAPYGQVFEQEEINRALASENPLKLVPSVDTNGHGTRLAAIAAGNRIDEDDFSGAAPEASLVIVKLKQAKDYLREFYLYPPEAEVYQEDDIMLAVAYAMRCAQRHQMPLSICIGLGSSQGAHQGYSPLSQYINSAASFTQNSVSIAAGNEGAARHHFQGQLTQDQREVLAELRVGEHADSFTLEFWGNAPEQYSVSIQSPTGETLPVSTALKGTTQNLRFVFVETRVLVNYIPIERQSGKTLVYLRFFRPAPGIWKFIVRGRDNNGSVFHMWLPVQGLISPDTYFLEASPYFTVTSPGDALNGITMTAYQASSNSLYLEASRGYNTVGVVKPNLAAPGVGIMVPLLKGGYGTASGTSLAAAQTAGIAALMFEWAIIRGNEPYFSGNSVKNYLQRGALRDNNIQYPNPEWGYGRVDLYHTFELMT
jgi:subtilisin family serine protease